MSVLKEFKAFAMKGNVVDLAVGIIIGASFGKIISSLVNDVLMPPLGILLGRVDFKDLGIVLQKAKPAVMSGDVMVSDAIAAVSIKYGMFFQNTIDFIIVAFAIFLFVRLISRLQKKEEAAPKPAPLPSNEEILLGEIRDLLKK